MSGVLTEPAVAVVICRDGRLPAGAAESVAEAGGVAVVAGRGAEAAAAGLETAATVWWSDIDAGPSALSCRLAALLAPVPLVILPASPDGRDLGPRLAAAMGRPLWAGAVRISASGLSARADLLRVDGRIVVPVEASGPVVATLLPGVRSIPPPVEPARCFPLDLGPVAGPESAGSAPDPEVLALIAPDPATMDLADATRVLAGGAGLVPRHATDDQARGVFALLAQVAGALGASMGATRVVTDAGWTGHERQIGTTGVTVDPDLYVAFGVSGATQHTGGLGAPRHIVSVNVDASCPMTAMADLGLVADATALLLTLAKRLNIPVPTHLTDLAAAGTSGRPVTTPAGGPRLSAGRPGAPGGTDPEESRV